MSARKTSLSSRNPRDCITVRNSCWSLSPRGTLEREGKYRCIERPGRASDSNPSILCEASFAINTCPSASAVIMAAGLLSTRARSCPSISRRASLCKDLYDHGAISLGLLEQAEDVQRDAQADLTAAEQQLNTLGIDKDHPSSIVNVYAPISGVIVTQNVTNASAAGVTFAGSSTTFTIADLSVVWIICDVYENDIPRLQVGQTAQIRINAFPDSVLTGRISDIGPVLDPSIRTAKVRIEVSNPSILRLGMFVTATLESKTTEVHAVCRPPQFCTCATATGFLPPRMIAGSGGWR